MATSAGAAATRIEIRRTFAAPLEKVFEAWTKPERLVQWFGRTTPQAVTRVVALDVRPGGQYCIEMQKEGRPPSRLVGAYREVRPSEQLAFTWWRPESEPNPSLVTVDFCRLGQGNFTEVLLTHESLPEKECEEYRQGWLRCFDKLEEHLDTAFVAAKEN